MPKSATTKRKGRPKTTGAGTPVQVRMLPGLLSALDTYRGDLSRPEAVRVLVKLSLIRAGHLAIADEDK